MSWGAFTTPSTWAPAAPSTLVLVDQKIPTRDDAIVFLAGPASALAPSSASVPLSSTSTAHAVALDAAAAAALLGPGVVWRAWRELVVDGALPADAEAAIRALALLNWHRANAFSAADGTPTAPTPCGRRRTTAAGRTLYPRVDPVAICLVSSADGQRCLLGRQAAWPAGMYSCVAGFVELGESAEAAAAREVLEETGVRASRVALVGSQAWPVGRAGGSELMLACTAVAADAAAEAVDVGAGGAGAEGAGELSDARWFSRGDARAMLARTHAEGFFAPPAMAIAHALIRRWAEAE
jgi:NAD+ diphosphatase